ncbi:MAG: alpha/beta hydrolase [Ignavibacteriales bacterium]|nr:alpha/beta hydrolase [Ignavibacteriales bacterium]
MKNQRNIKHLCFIPTFILIISIFISGVPQLANAQLIKSSRWQKEFSNSYNFTLDVVYNQIGLFDAKLDVYWSKDSTKDVPVLIWFHGGGWRRLSKDSVSGQLPNYLGKGWGIVNVDYRLTDTALAPAAVIDCRCALHWVVQNAKKYHFDPERIVISGTSAGGHLALMTGMLPDKNELDTLCHNDLPYKIAAIINWFGITDVNDLLTGANRKGYAVRWLGNQPEKELVAKKVSPLYYVSKQLPPIFTVHGDADTTVPYTHAVRLHKALSDSGVPNRLITISGGRHGKFSDKQNGEIYQAIDEFLLENHIESKK